MKESNRLGDFAEIGGIVAQVDDLGRAAILVQGTARKRVRADGRLVNVGRRQGLDVRVSPREQGIRQAPGVSGRSNS